MFKDDVDMWPCVETRAKGQFGSINSMHRFDAVSDDEDADDSNCNGCGTMVPC